MTQEINKLSALKIHSMLISDDHSTKGDGNCLYFENKLGRQRFIYRYRNGLSRTPIDISLGKLIPIAGYSKKVALVKIKDHLNQVRVERDKLNILKNRGLDPRAELKKQLSADKPVKSRTFEDATDTFLQWQTRNKKYQDPKKVNIIKSSMQKFVFPILKSKPIKEINKNDIRRIFRQNVINPETQEKGNFWDVQYPTAKKVLGWVDNIFTHILDEEEWIQHNPARKSLVTKGLPPTKYDVDKHYDFLPSNKIAAALTIIAQNNTIPARILEWKTLTVMRANAVLETQWKEINWKDKTWVVPASRMKGWAKNADAHVVPLSKQAIDLLKKQKALLKGTNKKDPVGLVFPNVSTKKPYSDGALKTLIMRLGWKPNTKSYWVPHGLRSTASSWMQKQGISKDIIDYGVLVHKTDKVYRSYAREGMVEVVRQHLQDYADHCYPEGYGND